MTRTRSQIVLLASITALFSAGFKHFVDSKPANWGMGKRNVHAPRGRRSRKDHSLRPGTLRSPKATRYAVRYLPPSPKVDGVRMIYSKGKLRPRHEVLAARA